MSTIEKVFEMIADSERPISGDKIGAALGISRAAVFKHIEKLRECGVTIESSKAGYAYAESDCLTAYTLSYRMKKLCYSVACLTESCDSTNNFARRRTVSETGDFLIAAPFQTSGKGRMGRMFLSQEGGAYFSLCVHPKGLIASDGLKSVLLCAVAVAEELAALGFDAKIKWPNDVFVNGKKICGILAESSICGESVDYYVFGIGINVNNSFSETELKDAATSLFDEDGVLRVRERAISETAARLMSLVSEYEKNGFAEIKQRYLSRSLTIGNYVTTSVGEEKIAGFAKQMTDEGFLLLDTDRGEITVYAGDVCLR